MSKYSKSVGSTTYGIKKIIPLTEAEAREWGEENLTGDEYEEAFGHDCCLEGYSTFTSFGVLINF